MGGSGNKEQQGGESNEVSRVTGTFRGIFSVICEDHVAFAFDLPTSSSFHNNFVFPPLLNAPPTTHLFLYSFIHYTHSSVVHVTQNGVPVRPQSTEPVLSGECWQRYATATRSPTTARYAASPSWTATRWPGRRFSCPFPTTRRPGGRQRQRRCEAPPLDGRIGAMDR